MNPSLSNIDDPFEVYGKGAKQVPQTKGTPAQKKVAAVESDDPFDVYSKANGVKKKEDIPSSVSSAPSGFNLSLESESIETSPERKTPAGFLASDIEVSENAKDKFGYNFLTEPMLPLSPQGIEEEKKKKRDIILTEPTALREYSKERITALQSEISNLESKIPASAVQQSMVSAGVPTIGTEINEAANPYAEEIASKKKYLEEFRKNVANVAAFAVASKEDLSEVSDAQLKSIGEKYLKTVSEAGIADDLEVLRTMDATGASKVDADRTSQSINFKLYKNGADVLARYYNDLAEDAYQKAEPKAQRLNDLLNQQSIAQTQEEKAALQPEIDALMLDEDLRSVLDAERKAQEYTEKSDKAIDQFPQVKRRALRQQLNDAYFNLQANKDGITDIPNKVASWIFGDAATEKDIPALAKEVGATEEQVREIIQSNIKGFFGSADESGVRIPGMLMGVAQAADETIAKGVMGAKRLFNVDNVGAKNRLLSDRLQDYNLKAQKAKLFDDAGKLNFNPTSVFNTMGAGIGQTALYAAPSLATGGAASVIANSEKIGKLLSVATTTGTGFVGSYEDAYKEAAQYTDDEAKRRAYATKVGLVNGLSESILEPADIVKKMPGFGARGGKSAFDAFSKMYDKKGVGAALAQGLKEFGKVVGTENIEELAALVGETKFKESELGVVTPTAEFMNQAIETAITTTITTLPLGIGAGVSGKRDASGIIKEGLFEAGNEPDLYKSRLKGLLDNGTLNQDQYNERVSVVNTMAKIVPSIKPTDINGNKLSYSQKANLAAQQFRILNNKKMLENPDLIEAEKPLIEADTNEALEIQTAILSGQDSNAEASETVEQTVEANQELRTQLADNIQNIESTNPMVSFMKNSPDEAINFIQEQATGMTAAREDADEPTYSETVKMFGEDIVNEAISLIPQEQKDMILKSWEAKGITPPSGLASALGMEQTADVVSVSDFIDKPVTYNGKRATILQDGQTLIAKIEGENTEYELGNIDEVIGSDVSEFGIEPEVSVVDVNDEGDIVVRGNTYKNNNENPLSAITYDNDGNVKSVQLSTENGQARTFRGRAAEDIAYQISLKEISKDNESREQFEEFVAADEQSQQEIISGENEVAATQPTEENNETVQREPAKRKPAERKKRAPAATPKRRGENAGNQVEYDGQKYANTPNIISLIKEAENLTKDLPKVKKGYVRLWRGNRPGEIQQNPSFTNYLVGIALPFKRMYGGALSYVDVLESELPNYVDKVGAAENSEFKVPKYIANSAILVEDSPVQVALSEEAATSGVATNLDESKDMKDASQSVLEDIEERRKKDLDKVSSLTVDFGNAIAPEPASVEQKLSKIGAFIKNKMGWNITYINASKEKNRIELTVDGRQVNLPDGATLRLSGGSVYGAFNLQDLINSKYDSEVNESTKIEEGANVIIDSKDSKTIKEKITTIEQAEAELRKMFAMDRMEGGTSGSLPVEEYTKRATAILSQLYPDAKVEVYENADEYYEKTGRAVGSLGAFNPVDKKLSLNLELIRRSGASNTILHEVIHPIVNEALLSDDTTFQKKINDAWARLQELKDVPGMQVVFKHVQSYAGRGTNIQKVEGITEFLTQVADGNIDLSDAPKSLAQKVIDLINDILKALGSSVKISSSSDLDALAAAIKQAFETSDASPIAQQLGKRKDSQATQTTDAINTEEKERAIRNLIERSSEVDQNKLKDLIKKYTGWSDEKINSFFKGKPSGIRHEDTKATAREFGFEEYEKADPETISEWDERAREAIKNGYNVDSLIDRISNSEYVPNKTEQRILALYIANLEAQMETNPSDENLRNLIRAVKASDVGGGREAARSLVARRGIGVRDNSLAGFFVRQSEANEGAPITDEQKAQNEKEYREIKEAQQKYEQKLIELERENAKLRAEAAVKKEASKRKPSKKSHADYVSERKEILSSIREKLKQARTGESGLTAVPVPYAKELIAIAPDVMKLTRSLVEEGVVKLADIVKSIHDDLKDSIDGITEKDIHDIIAGDYNERKPTKSEINRQLSDLRQQAKLENKLNDLLQGKKSDKKDNANNRTTEEIESLKRKISLLEEEESKVGEGIDGDDRTQKALQEIKKRTQTSIKKLENELKTGNYQEAALPKQPVKLDKEALALKDKLIELRRKREIRLLRHKYENRTKREKLRDKALEILNVPRTVMASLDYSAPLRQAIIPTISHPSLAAKAGLEMFKMSFSQKKFDRWFHDIKEDPRFEIMEESGLYVADPSDPRLTAKEEVFMNNISEKIPVLGRLIKASERAYVGYLNKMRVDLFTRMAMAFESEGFTYANSPELYKSLASWINNSTGRGGLGKIESAAPILNSAFFSPRLIASRFNILGLSDFSTFGNGFYGKMDSRIRNEAAKDIAKFVLAGISVLSLMALAGGDDEEDVTVEHNPRSTDFGKIRKGNTRWDIWGGFQQYVRLVTQLLTGEKKSASSGMISDLDGDGRFGESRGDVLARFVRGKLAPVPSSVWNLATGRNVVGEKVTPWSEAMQHLSPLIISDMKEAVRDKGVGALITMGLPAVFGVGVQTFSPRGYDDVDRKSGVYKTLYDKNLNLNIPERGDMPEATFKKFLPEREKIFKKEWDVVIKRGAMLNDEGGVTVDVNKGVAIKPFAQLTHEELTKLMQSISTKSTRQAERIVGYEKKKEIKNKEYLKR